MPRSTKFHSFRHQPYHGHRSLRLLHSHVNGPVPCLNPIRARFAYDTSEASPTVPSTHPDHTEAPAMTDVKKHRAQEVHFEWRSRNNRKGRSLLIIPVFSIHQSTASLHHILRNIRLIFTYFPYWDISYLVAFLFTFGSVVWVINGFFAWLPLQDPKSDFKYERLMGAGITAFIGATVFEFGSVLLVLESVNANQEGCFGWAVEAALEGKWEKGKGDGQLKVTSIRDERDHHYNRNCLPEEPNRSTSPSCLASYSPTKTLDSPEPQSWQWLSQRVLDGLYWTPQIVGGTGFIVSSALFMLEIQQNWYTPAPRSLGWPIGLWNLVGALGFTICGALGPAYGSSGSQYQAALATFWGSWSFLIASVIQWYESLGKWVVEHVTERMND
ncbi:hypothetical protein V1520DRAFT_371235 [Lipomyces starkeyi]|uniref:Integral membrane protein n=1 Tax=Lipomyces starkeyi NRRL Y-11557 TaxID=675824 RepID=A0A1E3PXD2_LIPST|nr:hypothetical protein LIPSTDRAFT_107719 [Lipomyces starkeyi NRRL Y-11557]